MTTTDTTYNGWTNRATWLVSLWWDNDEALANDVRPAMVGYARRSAGWDGGTFLTKEETVTRDLASAIRRRVEDPEHGLMPDLGASLAADLLAGALESVNWREIATNWLTDEEA